MSEARNPDSTAEGALLGAVVDDFLERQQRGDRPQIEEYARRYPELALVLRQLLPTLPLLRWSAADPGAPSPAVPEEFHVGGALGDYRIVREVGRGGMGVVYEAEQVSLGRRVALEVLPFAAALDARQLQRFKNEAQAAAQLHHTNIVPVFAVGSDRGVHYYAMQFIEGQSLATLIAELRRLAGREPGDPGGGPAGTSELVQELISGRWVPWIPRPARELQPGAAPAPSAHLADTDHQQATVLSQKSESRRPEFLRTVARLGAQAAAALEQAHSLGVIHRNIKPANLLVDLRGNLWVTDFGLARLAGDGRLTLTGDLLGTLRYMSPEQALAKRVLLDHRTDVYSLGASLYELATLETVFSGRDREELLRQLAFDEPLAPRRLNHAIPPELETIILKAMAKNPAERYDTAGDLADDLQRFLRDEPIRARRPTLSEHLWRWSRRHWAVLTTALVALGILLMSCTLISAVAALWLREERNLARRQEELANERAEEIRQGLEHLKAANALAEQARKYIEWSQWDNVHNTLTKAIQLRPDHAPLWGDRSELYARLGLWDKAAADLAHELELQEPNLTVRLYQHALLRLQAGDLAGYREACRRLRQRFGKTIHAPFIVELVRACLLGPDPDVDPAMLADLVQRIVDGNPAPPWWDLYILGIAYYRAGEHEQAVRWLRKSLTAPPGFVARAIAYPVLAMAHHRLGQAAEARQALEETARLLDEWARQREGVQDLSWVQHHGATGFGPVPWWDWLEVQHFYREASVLLTGSPPPDDLHEQLLRARGFAGLRWSARANEEYTLLLEKWPHNTQVRMEAHRNRAQYRIALQQWSLAATEFARASTLQLDDVILRQRQAVAHFRAGEDVGYRQTCADMLERFEKTEAPLEAGCVLWTCVLRADALPDRTRLVPLHRVASRWNLDGDQAIGAALYRSGQYDEAVRTFERLRASFGLRAWDWTFLAMAHHRLGHAAEARDCLAESARWIHEADRRQEDELVDERPTWQGWPHQVVGPLLLREAEEMIHGNDPAKTAD